MKKTFFITLLSVLFINTCTHASWAFWVPSWFFISSQDQLASAPAAKPASKEDILNELRGYLHCLNYKDREGICNIAEKMLLQSEKPYTQDKLYEYASQIAKSAIPEYLRTIIVKEVDMMYPNLSASVIKKIKESSERSLVGNLTVPLEKMNGIDCQKIAGHFDRAKMRNKIEQNKNFCIGQSSTPITDAPPAYNPAWSNSAASSTNPYQGLK